MCILCSLSFSLLCYAKSLQSYPTLCNPIDGSPPGSPVPGILQARTLEWVTISSPMHESEKWKWSRSVVSNSSRPHGLQPTRLLHPWGFPGKSTGVGCHFFTEPVTKPVWSLSSLARDYLFLFTEGQRTCTKNPLITPAHLQLRMSPQLPLTQSVKYLSRKDCSPQILFSLSCPRCYYKLRVSPLGTPSRPSFSLTWTLN